MKSVMILAATRDSHARAVEWLLCRRGIPTRVVIGTDFPTRLGASLKITGSARSTYLDHGSWFGNAEPDVIWRRRPGAPIVADNLHPADRLVADKESLQFFEGLQCALDQSASFSANSYAGAARARIKSAQLCAAVNAGLRIPDTLISNDPGQVRAFFDDRDGEVIIKSYSSPTWLAGEKAFYSYSSRLSPALLDKPESISAAPAIYQELVKKKYEVRTFFAGHEHFSVTLDSQSAPHSTLDWRARKTINIPIGHHSLPPPVAEKCTAMMAELGIVTGSIDFAVTEDDEYVFFEVNEQGQFLWMEEHCSSLPCLQMFCDFLLSGDPEFKWNGVIDPEESFGAYLRSGEWDRSVQRENLQHLIVERISPYQEFAGAS